MYTRGDIIKYQQDYWVVLNAKHDGNYLRIIRPHVGNEKREIKADKAVPTTHRVTAIEHNGKEVLVTRRGFIISLVSERMLMNTTRDGQAMLKLAGVTV